MKVLARGGVQRVSRPSGEYQLSVEVLEPLGKGSLQQAFEELKERLEKEGLFDAARKRPLPHAAAADRHRHLAHGRGDPGHPARPAPALREPRGPASTPRACRARRRRRRSCRASARCNARAGPRRADRGPRRRQPGGPLALQRGGGGAGAGRLAHPHHLRRGPRDRLHDRRLRGRPARAHALGGRGARGAGQGRDPRAASTACGTARLSGALGLRLARVRARVGAVTSHRVFEAERGRLRRHAQRVDELVRRAETALRGRVERARERTARGRERAGGLPLGPPARGAARARGRALRPAGRPGRAGGLAGGRAPRSGARPASSTASRRWPCSSRGYALVWDGAGPPAARAAAEVAAGDALRIRVARRPAAAPRVTGEGAALERRRRSRPQLRGRAQEAGADRAAAGEGRAAARGVAGPLRGGHPALAPVPRQARGGGGQDRAAGEGRARRAGARRARPAQDDAVRGRRATSPRPEAAAPASAAELDDAAAAGRGRARRAPCPPEDAWPATIHRAVRYSLFAGGKRIRPAAGAGRGRGGGRRATTTLHAPGLRGGDDPHLQPHPRRPAGHGRRRPAARQADLAQGLRRGHRHPGRRRAAHPRLPPAGRGAARGGRRRACAAACARRRVLGEAAGTTGLIGGQVEDLESEGRAVDAADLERLHRAKTGALLSACVRGGAVLGGAGEAELARLGALRRRPSASPSRWWTTSSTPPRARTRSSARPRARTRPRARPPTCSVHGLERRARHGRATCSARRCEARRAAGRARRRCWRRWRG